MSLNLLAVMNQLLTKLCHNDLYNRDISDELDIHQDYLDQFQMPTKTNKEKACMIIATQSNTYFLLLKALYQRA